MDTLREKESGLRRDQLIPSFAEDGPKSYPKLLSRDPQLR